MEDFCSYVGQAIDLFRYDPRSPMLFSSGLFLFVFLGFSLIYGLLKRRLMLRIVYVTLFSLYISTTRRAGCSSCCSSGCRCRTSRSEG